MPYLQKGHHSVRLDCGRHHPQAAFCMAPAPTTTRTCASSSGTAVSWQHAIDSFDSFFMPSTACGKQSDQAGHSRKHRLCQQGVAGSGLLTWPARGRCPGMASTGPATHSLSHTIPATLCQPHSVSHAPLAGHCKLAPCRTRARPGCPHLWHALEFVLAQEQVHHGQLREAVGKVVQPVVGKVHLLQHGRTAERRRQRLQRVERQVEDAHVLRDSAVGNLQRASTCVCACERAPVSYTHLTLPTILLV
eukprot:353051-Chlamydomonas_euryale.AAC.4